MIQEDSPTNPAVTSTIDVPQLSEINHIAYVKSDHLWVSGSGTLIQIDLSGSELQTVDDALCHHGSFAVTKDLDLLYVHKGNHTIKKRSEGGTTDIVQTKDHEELRCITISQRTGDLLVVINNFLRRMNRVIRYDNAGNSTVIVLDENRTLYKSPSYIAENRNGDIVVSDYEKKAVVVVDSSGHPRLNLRTHRIGSEFAPAGLCTDDKGHIIVLDVKRYIYIFNQDGTLTQILDKIQNKGWGLCVDDKPNLYVGNRNGTIDVYRY